MTTRSEHYYPGFDLLRITLAMAVMLYHDHVIDWEQAGSLAIQVFFALSGWLIGGILIELEKCELPRFYFNRALRIWVPYYVALGLLVCASLLRDPVNFKWLEFVVYKVTFVYNLFGPPQLEHFRLAMPLAGTGNHFWSVNAEEQFYFLAPLLLVVAPARFGQRLWLWALLAVLGWFTDVYASIVFGVCAVLFVHHYGALHLRDGARFTLFCVAALSAAGMAAGLNYKLMAPLFSITIVLLLAVPGNRNRVAAFLGGMSYPLYLNHWIGVFVANALFGQFGLRDSLPRQILAVALNLAVASALYWWIDRRILALRSALFSSRRGWLATSISYGSVLTGIVFGLTVAALAQRA